MPSTVWVDPRRLKQVLLQLLGQAIQSTEMGSVCLDVSRRAEQIRFWVVDTRAGFTPETVAQPAKAAEGAGNGTGVKSLLSHKLLEGMGSRLHLESDVGGGECYWFELPCQPKAAQTPAPVQEAAQAPAGSVEELPQATLANLKQLAARGDVMGLRKTLEQLLAQPETASNPKLKPLLELTIECRLRAVRELLNAHERDHSHR